MEDCEVRDRQAEIKGDPEEQENPEDKSCQKCIDKRNELKSEHESLFGDVIYAYTRAQALADGALIDVTEDAKESGIKYPTAVTESLWNGYIDPNERLKSMGQSARGRLWDVLLLFSFAARSSQKGCNELLYKVNFLMDEGGKYQQETVEIKAVCGPGDDGAPVITLMLPNED
jgi:hypothetical protein